MNLKDIKKLMKNNSSVFQIVKTDSCYNAKMDFELIEIDSILGIYKRISKITFNQFMKLNVKKIKSIASGSSIYQKHLYKFIKE
jgi:hypothetical protein